MASFVYNPVSGESSVSQWNRYLQQREFSNDLQSAIDSQTKTYREEFRRASGIVTSSINDAARRQAKAITEAAGLVAGRIESGFAELSNLVTGLENSVDRLSAMVDWRLSELVDQQRFANVVLGEIADLLRVPDVQKERRYHIEQAFKHYRNALLDADFYADALENFLEAEKRERSDYIVLHRIGMIYLYSPQLSDLVKAEEYLRRAAKYAVVESEEEAHRIFTALTKNIGSEFGVPDSPKAVAAESYFQAGVACYAQGKFGDAIELSGKAFSLLPSMLEAGFLQAKSFAADGEEDKAARIVEGLIKVERFYAVKTAADGDLAPKAEVLAALGKLRDGAVAQARDRLIKCRAAMMPGSEAGPYLAEIEVLAGRNTYLEALAALDALTAPKGWRLSSVSLKATQYERYRMVSTTNISAAPVAVSHDGRLLATPHEDRTCRLWDTETGGELRVLSGFDNPVQRLIFTGDDRLLITWEHFDTFRLWEVQTGKLLYSYKLSTSYGGKSICAFSSDGLLLAVLRSAVINAENEEGDSFSPFTRKIVFDTPTPQVHIFSMLTGRIVSTFPINVYTNPHLAFSPDKRVLAITDAEACDIYEISDGKMLRRLAVSHKRSGAITSDGKMVFNDGDVYDLDTGQAVCKLLGFNGEPALSPEGMLASHADNKLRLWDTRSGTLVFEYAPTQYSTNNQIVFSPNGKFLTTSTRGGVNLWRGMFVLPVESFVSVEKELTVAEDRRVNEIARERENYERSLSKVRAEIIEAAKAEYERQNKKWFGKNYDTAWQLFGQAWNIGAEEAKEYLREIRKKRST